MDLVKVCGGYINNYTLENSLMDAYPSWSLIFINTRTLFALLESLTTSS